jgi:hypothetical protein
VDGKNIALLEDLAGLPGRQFRKIVVNYLHPDIGDGHPHRFFFGDTDKYR